MGYIYSIRNTSNDKLYIGSTINLKKRWREHKWSLNNNRHHSPHLQKAWFKYGPEVFVWDILHEVKDDKCLVDEEQIFLDAFQPEYNVLKQAQNRLGVKHSEKTKQKLSKLYKGKTFEERFGKKRAEEIKEKIKNSNKNKIVSSETKQKISEAKSGILLSEKTKQKISEANKGQIPWNKDLKGAQEAWNKGKKLPSISDKHKQKISEAASKKTYIFDLEFNLIQEFDKIGDVIQFTKGSRVGVYNAIKNKKKFKNKYYISHGITWNSGSE